MSNSHNAKIILKRVKNAYHIAKDGDLAKFLDVAQSTLSSWKRRNSLDFERIFSKCEKLNKNWLLDGEAPIWKSEVSTHVNDPPVPYESIQKQLDRFVIQSIAEVEALDIDEEIKSLVAERLLYISHVKFAKYNPINSNKKE